MWSFLLNATAMFQKQPTGPLKGSVTDVDFKKAGSATLRGSKNHEFDGYKRRSEIKATFR